MHNIMYYLVQTTPDPSESNLKHKCTPIELELAPKTELVAAPFSHYDNRDDHPRFWVKIAPIYLYFPIWRETWACKATPKPEEERAMHTMALVLE